MVFKFTGFSCDSSRALKTKLSISIFKMGNVLKEDNRVTSLGTKINMKSYSFKSDDGLSGVLPKQEISKN